MTSISHAEWRFAWLVTGAVCLLILGTLVFGYFITPTGFRFLGVSASSPADSLIYFSYIEQARQTGHAFFWNVFSQEPSAPSFFSPLWALLGYIAGLFRLSTPVVFSMSLLGASVMYCVGLYWAIATFFRAPFERQVAFVSALVASGLGFFVGALPVSLPFGADLTYIPGFVLSTLLHSPLQVLSQLLLVVAFALFVQTERGHTPRIVFFGIVALIALLHPYNLVPLCAAIVAYAAISFFRSPKRGITCLRQTGGTLLGMVMVAAPIGLYFLSLRWLDTGIGGWLRQNITSSPTWVEMVLGFGPLLLVAIISVVKQRVAFGRAQVVLILWAVTVPILTYLPFPFQSRFANAYSVALAILGAPILVSIVRHYRSSMFLLWMGILLFFFVPTTLYNYISTYRRYSESAAVGHNSVYPSTDVLTAITWLRKQPRSVLLSQYTTSRVFSALSLQPSFQADSHQTLRYREKAAAWERLLENPRNVQSFMKRNGIRYYVETPAERNAFPILHEAVRRTLQPALLLPGVTLYQAKE